MKKFTFWILIRTLSFFVTREINKEKNLFSKFLLFWFLWYTTVSPLVTPANNYSGSAITYDRWLCLFSTCCSYDRHCNSPADGKQVEDGNLLGDCNIGRTSTLHMSLRGCMQIIIIIQLDQQNDWPRHGFIGNFKKKGKSLGKKLQEHDYKETKILLSIQRRKTDIRASSEQLQQNRIQKNQIWSFTDLPMFGRRYKSASTIPLHHDKNSFIFFGSITQKWNWN